MAALLRTMTQLFTAAVLSGILTPFLWPKATLGNRMTVQWHYTLRKEQRQDFNKDGR